MIIKMVLSRIFAFCNIAFSQIKNKKIYIDSHLVCNEAIQNKFTTSLQNNNSTALVSEISAGAILSFRNEWWYVISFSTNFFRDSAMNLLPIGVGKWIKMERYREQQPITSSLYNKNLHFC